MKIVVTGTRGIPGIQGGIETHCEELYPRIVDDNNHDVIVIRRSEYASRQPNESEFRGVRIKDISCIRNKYFEAILHTVKSILYARKIKADVVHIHAVGPALTVPLARLLGLKVVMTHHGEDYNRQKWGRMAKAILRIGEWAGGYFSNYVIVISDSLLELMRRKIPSQRNIAMIHNGVNRPVVPVDTSYLDTLGITKGQFLLAVGRLVEEKGFDLLIESFLELSDLSVKLVIAGDADHESIYSRKLKELADSQRVIFTGFIKGDKLSQLYANACLFVLPSYHEGLPIVLLEAMSYQCRILASDIAPNKEVQLPENCYFACGDKASLQKGIVRQLNGENSKYDLSMYDWDYIALKTKEIYDRLL